MKNAKLLLSILVMSNALVAMSDTSVSTVKLAILGFGGRAQDLLYNCLKERKDGQNIQVVAVCDDNAQQSLAFCQQAFLKRRSKRDGVQKAEQLLKEFSAMMTNVAIYPDTQEGLNALLSKHQDVDQIIIASSNYRHLEHLQETLKAGYKKIFIEKPILQTLEQFQTCNGDIKDATVHVGLCLCYAPMAGLAAQFLVQHKSELGQLQKVRSWEHVNFAHGLTIIMMNWRRDKDLSGGLLLEKSVHDLHLILFWLQALGLTPEALTITTETSHEFFKKSRHEEIVSKLLHDEALRDSANAWDSVAFQRVIPFCYNATGAVDWTATMQAFFKDFPDDDDLQTSNIIPDRHKIMASMQMQTGNTVDFELQVKLNDFETTTQRGTHLSFEHGDVIIDIENGTMFITKKDAQDTQEFDLKVNNASHGGGDVYVAQAILGTLPADHTQAMFNDPAVQLSTLMALVSEDQALRNSSAPVKVTAVDGKWVVSEVGA